jgi:hypothetical protein
LTASPARGDAESGALVVEALGTLSHADRYRIQHAHFHPQAHGTAGGAKRGDY